MRLSINSLVSLGLGIVSFVAAQYGSNVVQNFDIAAVGDGPNGYAFSPRALAIDSSNNIIFLEVNSIRMINGSGVTTVSGPNTVPQGVYNGLSGIAVDSKGNLIVADALNNAVKRIDINGRVTVIGTSGNSLVTQIGTSTVSTFASGFNGPNLIAFDASSNLYVSDLTNNVVKKIFPNGTVVNFASVTGPLGMCVDSTGNLYVGTGATHNVYKITPAGSVSLLAGSGSCNYADGTGSSASFCNPYPGVVDSNGTVYVADEGNYRIRKITTAGVVTTVAGSGASSSLDGLGISASFFGPTDVKLDAAGNLIVVDYNGCKVRNVSPSGAVTTIAGNGTCASANGQGTAASFNGPTGVALDGSGNIYVSDQSSSKIRMINASNYVTTLTGFNGAGLVNGNLSVAQFKYPWGLAIDPKTGSLFVSDYGNNVIRKITLSSQKSTPALPFNSPTGVAVDSLGNIFLADQLSHMIKVINTTGVVNILAGSGNASFANGNGISASFNSPYGIALDLYGNVIVADTGNNMIRNVSTSGSVTTIAGNGTAGWVDGQGTNSLLSSPMGLSVDGSNRVFITDSGNNCIRIINATGFVNTLFFGRGSNLALNAPQGILVAPNGDLFIADTGNKRIRTVPASILIGRI